MIDINDCPFWDNEQLFSYLRYNSYRSERYKLLYVATPKVACTSLKWWFAALEGYSQVLRGYTDSAESDPDLIIHDTFHKVAPNVTGLMPEAILEALTSDSYFRFAVVRNPYKRIFSAWQSKILLREPLQIQPYFKYDFFHYPIKSISDIAIAFEGFLEQLATNEAPSYWDEHWAPQVTLLRPDLINYTKLVKIENPNELSHVLADKWGSIIPSPFAGRRTNESLIPYLSEFVTVRSAELIRSLYAQDFETFGYDKHPPEGKETFSDEQFNLAVKAIDLIRGRHQRLNERSQQIVILHEAVGTRDTQLIELHEAVGTRDTQLIELHEAVGTRDTQLIELHEAVGTRDTQLVELHEAVGARDTQLIDLHEAVGTRGAQLVSMGQALQDVKLEQARKNTSTNHALRESRRKNEQQIAKFKQAIGDRDAQIVELKQMVSARNDQIEALNYLMHELQHANKEMLASTSWWVTKPLRAVSKTGRYLWHALPIYSNAKRKLKGFVFICFPWLFSWSSAYRAWKNFNTQTNTVANDTFIDDKSEKQTTSQLIDQIILDQIEDSHYHLPLFDEKTDSEYVPLLISKPLENKPVKLICFYLPQFHSIKENNEWWGNGFTEWTNVEPARSQFEGHYQPHVPGELGYYNLLDTEVQRRQVELAKLYGIEGFCFYFYWFAGKRLLEAPLQNYLNDSSLDLPFCLCWANENWTRRWDGLDNEILIAQDYSPQDDLAFIAYIAQYMRDPRYIRIDGKPLLIVYRPGMLPSVKESVNCWRQWCKSNGIGEIYIAYSQSFEAVDPREYGFDAAIEFPPNHSTSPNITDTVIQYGEKFNCTVYDWQAFVDKSNNYHQPDYKLFRGVCPSWDNTARRKNTATAFLNSTPALYQKWLENAVQDTVQHQANPDERLVFINAWNEWAEGAHLEPDTRYGYAWLQATRNALVNVVANDKRQKIIVVSHDAHSHGAQFLALGMVRSLKQDLHLEVEVVLLGKGRLTSNFVALAPVHDLSDRIAGDEKITHLANLLVQRGFTRAIVNTTVSGVVIPAFHKAGIESICLVHELPGVIQDNKLENQAKQIANYAKTVVFPAQIVADGFVQFAQIDQAKQIIRPQGLYRRNKWRLEKQAAKVKLRADLGLNPDTKIVLTVGYVDHRKGADLFVECALTLLAKRTDVDFVWVGHWEQTMQKEIEAKLSNNPYKHRIHFVGYNPETALFHAASDVYALTSREDPFPNVVLESFDAGVPVVAFAGTGGAANLVENLGGRVVPLENVDKFSDAVCELLDSSEICSSLGVAGQNYVDKHFAFRPYMFELCSMLGIELPKISVVVPNYNYARYIEERLTSIRNQSIPIYELIILDDASTDNSIHKISDWLAATQTEAKVVINQNNSGSVFAQWQKGIEIATGDFLWIAEADDLSDPDFLETVMPPLVSGEVVLSYCESQQMNSHGTTQVKNYHNYLAAVCQNKWKSAYVTTGDEEIKSSLAILNTIPNVSAVVFKLDTINTVFKQHFDEIMQFKKAGDWVVYIYTLAHGDIAFSPRTANRHRRHDQSVVGESCQESLLKEIITVQEIAGKMHQISDGVRQKVEAYRSVLTK